VGLLIPEPLGRELIWIGHCLGCDYSFNSQDLSENLPKPLLSRNKIFYACEQHLHLPMFFKGDPTLVIQSKHWNWSKKIHLSYSIKAWSGRWLRLPLETLKICPQHVGIKPKPLLREFNLPVETLKICPQLVGIKPSPFWENLIPVETLKICTHKNLPCV